MAISPASAKAKGRKLQQWVRDFLLSLHPDLEPDDIKSTSMGAGGEDVQLSPAARKLIPISVECKARQKIQVYQWYDQAISNCKAGIEPVVILKADRKKPLALIDAETLFTMMVKNGR